jgi:hypothetical protein
VSLDALDGSSAPCCGSEGLACAAGGGELGAGAVPGAATVFAGSTASTGFFVSLSGMTTAGGGAAAASFASRGGSGEAVSAGLGGCCTGDDSWAFPEVLGSDLSAATGGEPAGAFAAPFTTSDHGDFKGRGGAVSDCERARVMQYGASY